MDGSAYSSLGSAMAVFMSVVFACLLAIIVGAFVGGCYIGQHLERAEHSKYLKP